MTEKRFILVLDDDYGDVLNDNMTGDAYGFEREYRISIVNVLNMLHEENQSLKAQLHCPFDSICAICSNEYLVQKDKYYISKCRKGHEQCSKTDVLYCDDFEKGGLND